MTSKIGGILVVIRGLKCSRVALCSCVANSVAVVLVFESWKS